MCRTYTWWSVPQTTMGDMVLLHWSRCSTPDPGRNPHTNGSSTDSVLCCEEESDQFRFLCGVWLSHLRESVGLIIVTDTTMRISIPLELSTCPFIPLPHFIRSRHSPPLRRLLVPSLVLFPPHSSKCHMMFFFFNLYRIYSSHHSFEVVWHFFTGVYPVWGVFIIPDKVKTRRGGVRKFRCYERRRVKDWGNWILSHTRWSGDRLGCDNRYFCIHAWERRGEQGGSGLKSFISAVIHDQYVILFVYY